MTEETEPARAKKTLPPGIAEDLERFVKAYGLDAVAQGLRDICANQANKGGPDTTRLTPEQRREARLWSFDKNAAEKFLRATLDHGHGSGCK